MMMFGDVWSTHDKDTEIEGVFLISLKKGLSFKRACMKIRMLFVGAPA